MLFLLFSLALALGSLLLFALFYAMSGRRTKRVRSIPPVQMDFDILERGRCLLALRSVPSFSLFFGGLFAGAFYWALPIMIWRYGWRRAANILLVCLAIGTALGFLAASLSMVAVDFGPRLLLGQLLLVPVRGLAGIYVAKRDGQFRLAALTMRGWSKVGACNAVSARAAVKSYGAPVGPPKPSRGWRQRLRRPWPWRSPRR